MSRIALERAPRDAPGLVRLFAEAGWSASVEGETVTWSNTSGREIDWDDERRAGAMARAWLVHEDTRQ